MASVHLVLVAAVIICFCPLPANASHRRARALVTQITKDPGSQSYTIEIRQRTPLQIQRLVLDIEQDYMWVRCDEKSYISSTYRPLGCRAQLCKSYQYSGCGNCFASSGPGPGCNNLTCLVPGPSYSIELAKDVLALPSSDGSTPGPLARFSQLAFACNINPFHGIGGTVGVAGMTSSTLSLPSQLSAAAGFSRKFAMCLPSDNVPGVLFFGDEPLVFLPPPGRDLSSQLIRTPLIKNPVYTDVFYLDVQRIEVGGVQVPIDAQKLRFDQNGFGGTKLSTVVRCTQLASPIYKSLEGVFTSVAMKMNISRVASVRPYGACFNSSQVGYTRGGAAVPTIDIMLRGNGTTTWSIFGSNSMVGVNDKVLCLAFVDGGDNMRQSIVIGTYQMQDNLLQFDLATSTLGFSSSLLLGQTRCSNFNFTTPP